MLKPTKPAKALVVLSGGQDSTTCLFWAKQHFDEIHAVTFDYGQRHKVEIEAAKKIAEIANVASHEIIVVGDGILQSTSPLVSDEELEQYADNKSLPGGLEKTFVPMRNTLFLTIAANRAYALGAFAIITGVCEEDFGGYPDCREVFIRALQTAFNRSVDEHNLQKEEPFQILAPLMTLTKAKTCRLAFELGEEAFNALAFTHTAYDGAYPPTGHDHATLLRQKGFEESGLPDPLIIRAVKEGLMEYPETENYNAVAGRGQLEEPPQKEKQQADVEHVASDSDVDEEVDDEESSEAEIAPPAVDGESK